MTQRINYQKVSPALFRKLFEMGQQVKESGLGDKLIDLVNIRASAINGCAFCTDMHVKEAKMHGERELRVYHVGIWRESPLFSDKERAALEWTEVVTRLPEGGIPDDVYQRVSAHFSEKELSDLTFAVAAINMWNRLNVGFLTPPGSADALLGLTKAGLS
ncbi:MAG TPA: carboxymuconolactone decarboxylase family protein [Myxococcales bacterium]|nr:carboxymuconolactone decarboxylase family protein [Myxococcales bacterium]